MSIYMDSSEIINKSQILTEWKNLTCHTFLTVDCLPGQNFYTNRGSLKVQKHGFIELVDSITPDMTYLRNSTILKNHTEDHFQLVLTKNGKGSIEQNEQHSNFVAGDLILYSAKAPSLLTFNECSRTLTLKIPRVFLINRLKCKENELILHLDGTSSIGIILSNLIQQIYEKNELQNISNDTRFLNGMLDFISVAFDSACSKTPQSHKKNQLELIKQFIHENLSNSELKISEIANQHNISIRTLNRIFAAEGTTVNKWIWQQRLDHSYKYLSEKKVRQVGEAALNSGFNDFSHFSKLFKKTYGMCPNQLLNK